MVTLLNCGRKSLNELFQNLISRWCWGNNFFEITVCTGVLKSLVTKVVFFLFLKDFTFFFNLKKRFCRTRLKKVWFQTCHFFFLIDGFFVYHLRERENREWEPDAMSTFKKWDCSSRSARFEGAKRLFYESCLQSQSKTSISLQCPFKIQWLTIYTARLKGPSLLCLYIHFFET